MQDLESWFVEDAVRIERRIGRQACLLKQLSAGGMRIPSAFGVAKNIEFHLTNAVRELDVQSRMAIIEGHRGFGIAFLEPIHLTRRQAGVITVVAADDLN